MSTSINLPAPIIRRAVKADETAIRHCAKQAYARYIGSMGRKPAPMTAEFDAQISAGHIHVALSCEGNFLGYIVFFPDEHGMHIESVAVLPSAAGRGIGKKLIGFCENQACRQGVDLVHLYTNERMADNLKIYRHLGYVETARRVEAGFHRVFFEKKICQSVR